MGGRFDKPLWPLAIGQERAIRIKWSKTWTLSGQDDRRCAINKEIADVVGWLAWPFVPPAGCFALRRR